MFIRKHFKTLYNYDSQRYKVRVLVRTARKYCMLILLQFSRVVFWLLIVECDLYACIICHLIVFCCLMEGTYCFTLKVVN